MSGAGTSDSETLHVRVEGRVQGVGFRRFVERSATALGLSGWTRNLTDGAVEVLALGPATALHALRERLVAGPPYAAVARLVDLPADVAHPAAAGFALLPDADPGAPVPRPETPR